ncbi:hypothetical protein JZ751_001625 [Albula glossodonta]|uniref:Uncharacterized protein n=1 Tax=Albula glossodonta TaxID=121402 RepID=A0A8T2PTX1_9TELE|nr:hypothetical protein JZ751_001625 [Albula glossodonta]
MPPPTACYLATGAGQEEAIDVAAIPDARGNLSELRSKLKMWLFIFTGLLHCLSAYEVDFKKLEGLAKAKVESTLKGHLGRKGLRLGVDGYGQRSPLARQQLASLAWDSIRGKPAKRPPCHAGRLWQHKLMAVCNLWCGCNLNRSEIVVTCSASPPKAVRAGAARLPVEAESYEL